MAGRLESVPQKSERDLLSGPSDLFHAAAHTFAQTPIDGVTQLVGKISGQDLKPFQLVSAPKEQNGWTTAGSIAGSVAQFVTVSKVLRLGLAKADLMAFRAPMTAMEAGVSGAAVDLLHPVSKDEANFGWAKLRNAGVAFGTFAVMTGTSNKLSEADLVRRAGRRTLAESVTLHGFTGAVGGVTNAELEALGQGKLLPNRHNLLTRTEEYALFGALFGGADVMLNSGRIRIRPAENNSKPGRVPTTEQWVKSYDGSQPLESPLLNWIAENRPALRPPGYDAWKAKLSTTPSTELRNLDLSAWTVEQRPALLAEVRKLASGTQLSADSNIDAFISRIDLPELREYASPARAEARGKAFTQWTESSGRLKTHIDSDATLREMHWDRLLSPEVQQPRPDLTRLINETRAAETAYGSIVKTHLAETKVESAMSRALNSMAAEVGLPKIQNVKVSFDHRDGWYSGKEVGLGDKVIATGHSGNTAETSLHEFVHHDFRPGFLRGLVGEEPPHGDPVGAQIRIAEELSRLSSPGATLDLLKRLGQPSVTHNTLMGSAKQDVRYYVDAARDGNINTATWDEAAINTTLRDFLQSRLTANRLEAWNRHMRYVGSFNELPAWSTGFLTRIRSRALGLPDPDARAAKVAPVLHITELEAKSGR
jgi:hypothetical protein